VRMFGIVVGSLALVVFLAGGLISEAYPQVGFAPAFTGPTTIIPSDALICDKSAGGGQIGCRNGGTAVCEAKSICRNNDKETIWQYASCRTSPGGHDDPFWEDCTLSGKMCVDGECVTPCVDQCVLGSRKCDPSGGYRVCGNYDSDSCSEWSGVSACGEGLICHEGACKVDPVDCAPVPSGIVSSWEGYTSGLIDSAKDMFDGNDGEVNGVEFVSGFVDGAFSFDGVDDYIRIPHAFNLEFDSLTIEGWIRPDDTSSGSLFDKEEGRLLLFNGKVACGLGMASGILLSFPGSTSISIGEWTHVACTYDMASGVGKIYLNGLEDGIFDSGVLNNPLVSDNNDLTIGNDLFLTNPYSGLIDELSIYDRALSIEEVQEINKAGRAGKCELEPAVCAPVPDGIVSWWDGRGSGISLEEEVDDIVDGNYGVPSTINWQSQQGYVNSFALEFDGVDDYIQVPDADNLDVSSITIEGWIRPDEVGSRQTILSKFNPIQGSWNYAMYVDTGSLYCIVDTSKGSLVAISASNSIPFGQWTHVACIYNEENGLLEAYMGGNRVGLDSLSQFASIIFSTGDISIGALSAELNDEIVSFNYFDGLIDELSLYNRDLGPEEILTIYEAGSAGKCRG